MKLDYNIIWIDDKSDTRPFESMVSNVRKHLEEQFFNCNIQLFEDFDEFQDSFSDVIQYDLIITDLSLSNETTGKQVIDFVRENKHNHTEIFFYSANQTLKATNLLNFNRITFFQLSTENYRELEYEITELIDLTIQKFQHIAAMRGMIMHETSSLDIEMENILKHIIQKSTTPDDVIKVIKSKYLETNDNFNKEINETSEIETILFKIGASHRWRGVLRNIPKGELKLILQDYEKEVINIRNKFAHAVLEKDPITGREFFKHGESGITFNEELCRKIRKDINKHRINFEKLDNSLK